MFLRLADWVNVMIALEVNRNQEAEATLYEIFYKVSFWSYNKTQHFSLGIPYKGLHTVQSTNMLLIMLLTDCETTIQIAIHIYFCDIV